MGSQVACLQHLDNILRSDSKIDHGLVKSDINPKDRQNFSSCIKISSDDVLKILYDQNDTKGTYVYLSLINLTISAFIDTTTPIDERLYYAWV
ncbi:unnamed protein product [Didymodactylos carnosus]|nr:unnamed protein product [Didymodactylos carnosus]CAF4628394.1 unnamed protein product [Didymodactylos carnosus]